jgi:glycosyltransferase involved in cell wall biosynthesis
LVAASVEAPFRDVRPVTGRQACPSISVLIPTYQRKEVVRDAVRALGRVRYGGEVEVVVVVDGSTDGTAAALARVESAFPLRIFEQPNRGPANARNRAAAEARGEILLFIDDDMIATPEMLEEHGRSHREGADAVVGDFPVELGSRRGFLSESIARQEIWERDELILSPFEVFSGHISVKRSAFEAVGRFDEEYTANGKYGNEDIDFGQRLLRHGYRIRRNPKAVCYQRSLVGPHEYMRRARSVAEADVQFADKHPELAEELFERRGLGKISRKLELLSRAPLLPQILGTLVVSASAVALRTPFRSSRSLAYLFNAAYLVTYWSALRALVRSATGKRAIAPIWRARLLDGISSPREDAGKSHRGRIKHQNDEPGR